MTVKLIAASAAALMALCGAAQAGTITQLSTSIILLGDPAPVEAAPVQRYERHKSPDVLAAGERRQAGMAGPTRQAPEIPVAEDEKTSAIGAPSDDASAAPPPFMPLQDAELRQGS